MKPWLRFSDVSIFNKIMAAFLAVLVPLFAVTWTINDKGAESISSEISRSIMNTTSFYLGSLEKEAARVVQLLPNYLMDNELMELGTAGDELSYYERAQNILALQKKLELMKSSSPYIKEVKAYVPKIGRTITNFTYNMSVEQEEYDALRRNGKSHSTPFVHWDGRLFISMQYPDNTRKPLYMISVELSTKAILDTLDQISRQLGGTSELVDLDYGWEISSANDEWTKDSIRSFLLAKQEAASNEGHESLVRNGRRSLVVYQYSAMWNAYLVSVIPEQNILAPIKKYRTLFWVAGGIGLLVVMIFSFFLFRLIYQPLMKLVYSFRLIRKNRLEPILIDRGRDEFGYLYQAFNETVESLRKLIQDNYEQQIQSQRSELKRLQSQINPHFLYNCFFVLCRLIKSGSTDKAYQFCQNIGQYFLFITRDDEDEIPLEREIGHARTYVDIQTICFGDRIEVWFDLESVPPVRILRFVLQPVIENTYKHAFGMMNTPGELWVHGELSDNEIVFFVEDNGNLLADEDIDNLNRKLEQASMNMEETTGLANVHRRIQLHYGTEFGVKAARSELGGLQIQIGLGIL